MDKLNFCKMEGAGNDFIVLDNREIGFSMEKIIEFTPKLCDRRYGIGADGILVLDKTELPDSEYKMIYRNADGSDAGMCGNGGRCIALFATKRGFANKHSFNVHENVYRVDVGSEKVSIHFPVQVSVNEISIDGEKFIQADAATDHLISFTSLKDLQNESELAQKGRSIRMNKKVNPPGTNVNFVCFENSRRISVKTYERGVEDLTLACGTGALASAIATHYQKKLKVRHAKFEVQMKGGLLTASFNFNTETNIYQNLILTGPAHFVFEGSISV